MPQGLSWEGETSEHFCAISQKHPRVCHCWHHFWVCSFIRSHSSGYRGAGSKQQDIFVALTKGGENCCGQPMGWGNEQRNRLCWAIFNLPEYLRCWLLPISTGTDGMSDKSRLNLKSLPLSIKRPQAMASICSSLLVCSCKCQIGNILPDNETRNRLCFPPLFYLTSNLIWIWKAAL